MVSREVKKARYDELIKQGMSPSEALHQTDFEYGEGYSSTPEPKVEQVFEQKTSPEQEYVISDSDYARQKYAEAKAEASELYEKGKDITLRAAGLKERNLKEAAISTAGKILKAIKPKPLTKEQKEIQQAYNEAKYRAQVESAKAQGRASGYGGYSVARQPKRVKTVIVMRPPRHQDLPLDDMGMGNIFGAGLGLEQFSGVRQPVREFPSKDIGRQVQTRVSEPRTEVRTTRHNPVTDRSSNFLVNIGGSFRNNLTGIGNARNPVNVGTGRVSTRIPRTEKVSVKFKGRKPKTRTQKPRIETKVVTEKQFWEL